MTLLAILGLAATVILWFVSAIMWLGSWVMLRRTVDGSHQERIVFGYWLVAVACMGLFAALSIWQPLHWAGVA